MDTCGVPQGSIPSTLPTFSIADNDNTFKISSLL